MKGKSKIKTGKRTSARERKIQEIKKKLLLQKETLLSEAGGTMHVLPEETIFPELGDQASAESDKSFMLLLRERERQLLKKIDEALEKIDYGSYGICEACSVDIGIKRLEARPVTTMCIDCKTEQEEEEKLRER